MAYLQTEIISHTRKVCGIYKRALQLTNERARDRLGYRFHAVVLRQRFEENRHLTDAVQIQTLIDNAEDELFKGQHYQPLKYAYSPGGVAYGRTLKSPDWVLDLWHPDEKAQYPEFFARRAQLKKEYVEYWEKKYGKAEEPHHH